MYEGRVRMVCPLVDEATLMFQKLRVFQLVAERVNPTSFLPEHVWLMAKLYWETA